MISAESRDGMTLQTEPPPTTSSHPAWEDTGVRDRVLLVLGTLACMLLFWAAARQFGIPAEPGHSASLLQQPNAGVAIIITALAFVASVFVGTTFTASVHRDAGIFCACLGLAVLSARGGPMRYVLFEAAGRSVYLMLAGELLVLGALLAAAWIAVDRFVGPSPSSRLDDAPGADADQKYFTTIMQVLLMIALMSLLAQTDSKSQAMAAVGASAMLAAMAANWFAPASPSPWLWAGPFVVGLIGYLSCYFKPEGIEVGRTSGYFAALARPLPLDYASIGVAGALLGYWTSSRWHQRAAAATPPAPGAAESAGSKNSSAV